jgi:hypothetical protein
MVKNLIKISTKREKLRSLLLLRKFFFNVYDVITCEKLKKRHTIHYTYTQTL